MILAPLRGVTIRCFRETFADEIRAAGFSEAVTPFVPAMSGLNPLKDRELLPPSAFKLRLTPQLIGKDPMALRCCLERLKGAGYETADLNCGCPFPMVMGKHRGSGMLKTPDVLSRMLEVGCEVLGEGKFSMKTRLGVDRNDELLELMPMINSFPLRYLTVHARNARQMFEGECDQRALDAVVAESKVPVVANGDLDLDGVRAPGIAEVMVGRAFIRDLGRRDDARELVFRYMEASQRELSGDRPVLGRIKELLSYWKDQPKWHSEWNIIKICRSVDELRMVL